MTHWQHAPELAERFPAATVASDQIFVQDGSLWTSVGVTAGIDLALKLIEDDHRRDVALSVARRLVVFLKTPYRTERRQWAVQKGNCMISVFFLAEPMRSHAAPRETCVAPETCPNENS